ncbi:MAG: Chitin synthase, class 5 [Peltula sp. TS41687]|nr:MAG: Chitin synthase, class 5 [Peltula sp. TS41687]
MLFSLTVGKVDAGVAVLLTQDKRVIEFPSILLPPAISSGSIVDISVSRNLSSEASSLAAFTSLQNEIFTTFGQHSPSPPVLRCRNATQTCVVLEWDAISLATAELRSLSLYRNGSKAGSIPRALETQSTKISGLAIDTAYTFHLVLRTSAGVYASNKLAVRTHKMTDLSGITVTPGVLPAPLKESLERAVERIGARLAEGVRIDTTHFVCTEGRGQAWERAVEMNIPVVRPEWLEGCEREGRIVGVRGYYLNADPRLRTIGQGGGAGGAGAGGGGSQPQSPQQQQQQQQNQQWRDSVERRPGAPDRMASAVATSTTIRKENQRPPLPPSYEEHEHEQGYTAVSSPDAEKGEGNAEANVSVNGTDEEASSNPPTPPMKDDAGGRPVAAEQEPKTMGREEQLKSRLEDGDQLGKRTSAMARQSLNGNRMMDQGSEEAEDDADDDDGRSAADGDGESGFSEVAL